MNEEKEDLFEGLQIMSPEELNSVVEAEKDSEEQEETKTESKEDSTMFQPVESEEGEGAYENTKNQTDSKTTTSSEKSEEIYKGLIKELVDSNIITAAEADKLDELEGSLDTIKELMNKTVQTNFKAAEQEWKDNMPAAKKRF